MSGVEGRIAVVTGAAQGIGAGIARHLAAAGAKVAIVDIAREPAEAVAAGIVADGGTAIAVGTDISLEHEVAAFERIAVELGPVAILVNNAGVLRDNLLFKMSVSDWDTVLGVHLRGAFLCSRAAQRAMVEQRYGRIINIASRAALGNRGQANYSAAKAGLQGLTKTLAIELGPFGITANSVTPGFIETPMTATTAQRIGTTIEEMRAATAARLPVRLAGVPDDIANAVKFFAAEESRYVTGQDLYVDGGRGLL